MRHVLAIDQGTTGTTVLVLDEELRLRGRGYQEFRQIYPQPGWVEHDPEDIWGSVTVALDKALATSGVGAKDIAAIGITNQRETSVLWDRKTGAPVHNAIVWQDRRTADRCAELKSAGKEARVRELTGLTLDPYFSGTKLAWMLERHKAGASGLAFGTIDTYLVWRLTGGATHATDVSNACFAWNCRSRTVRTAVTQVSLQTAHPETNRQPPVRAAESAKYPTTN